MKKILFFILFLLFPSIAYAVPATTMSISPSATDATTITASDENTRNSTISTIYNNHDHNDIDQTANTVAVGDAVAGNKTIQANNADTNKPFIRYDDTNNRWVSSRDGTTVESFVILTGATAQAFVYTPTKLRDADENTLIQVEESVNENIVRIDTAGTERWIMTAAGERTMPTQPAFLVLNSGAQSNMAASGSPVTIVLDSELYDQSNDFSSNTFTAPVTGRYYLSIIIALTTIDTAATEVRCGISTSNRVYVFPLDPRQFVADIAGRYTFSFSVLADMDVNDTAIVFFTQDGGTGQVDIASSSDAYFSGYLSL